MNYSYLIGFLVLLASCGSTKQALQKPIEIPTAYSTEAEKKPLDSIQPKDTLVVPRYTDFFKDPLLVQLIDSALTNNQDLLIAYARIQQARAGMVYTRGIRLPELNAAVSAGVRKFGDYTIDGVGNYDTKFSPNLNDKQRLPNPVPDYFVGVHSTWEIDLWGKLKNKKRAAFQRYLSSEQGRKLIALDLIYEVANKYYTLMLLDRELQIIEESILLQENALSIVQAQMESGKANELGIQLMSAQVLKSKNLHLEVEQEIIRHENALNLLLGRYPQVIERSDFSSATTSFGTHGIGIPSALLQNRPDILQAEHQLLASHADLKSAKAAFYPTIQLSGSVGLQSFRLALLFESPASLAFNLASGLVMPVLNRRTIKAELLNAKGKQLESYLHYEKTIVTAFSEVYELLRLKEKLDQIQQLKTQEVNILAESVETAGDLYLSGRSSYLEIITAQDYFLQTQIEALQVQLRNYSNQLLLYKALGGGI